MNFRLESINEKMGKDIYDMYQDISKFKIGSIIGIRTRISDEVI